MMRAIVVTAAALVGLAPACSEERPPSEEANPAAESSGTETATETGTETGTGAGTEAPEPPVDPSLLPVEGETPPAAVARCEETAEPDTCVMLALDEAPELRARERQRVIEAHQAIGNEARMFDHMEAFLEDYPRDRRGNGYRLRLRAAGRL